MDREKKDELFREKEIKIEKQQDFKRIITIAVAVFVTFVCCILFFFVVYRYNGFADYWKNLSYIMQPITMGLVLAYLLNPVLKFIEKYILRFIEPHMKSRHKARKTARGLGITGSLLFLAALISLLLVAIIPAVTDSITSMVNTLPDQVNASIDWLNEVAAGDSQFAAVAEEVITRTSEFFENWVTDILMPQAQLYITSITSGVITGVKFLINILVGIIISVYVMSSKEIFAGQAKRIVYAMFKPVRANVIVETVRKSNEIFGGFISGKLLDSAIIGVLTYIVLAIMKMPDTILIAVIIGVTNIIPFFGPFIGAVPSFIIIALQNPIQGLYFLIFVVVLQQVDGNIIGPKILGSSTGLSSFWVVFAILVFGGLWGFPGMLLGVPIMAVIYYVIGNIVSYSLRKRGIPESKIDYVKLASIDKRTNEPRYEIISGKEKSKNEKLNALKEELKKDSDVKKDTENKG